MSAPGFYRERGLTGDWRWRLPIPPGTKVPSAGRGSSSTQRFVASEGYQRERGARRGWNATRRSLLAGRVQFLETADGTSVRVRVLSRPIWGDTKVLAVVPRTFPDLTTAHAWVDITIEELRAG